jgi:anti-sigma factor RsiW
MHDEKKASPPTDLELMAYADGELEDPRRAEVEAWLASHEAPRQKLAALDLVSEIMRGEALEGAAGAGSITDAVMAKIDAEEQAPAPANVVPLRRKRPSSAPRTVYMIAASVVAAAAGMMLWGRTTQDEDARRRNLPPSVLVQTTATATATTEAPKPDAPKPEGDVEHGVEVAAVNTGGLPFTLFYVPSGTAASGTTTVVWFTDDSAGGDE